MCDVPSIAVFCNESVECFPGTASILLLLLLLLLFKNCELCYGVLLKESGTIWCLFNITINPTVTVVVMLTDKCCTGQVHMGPFINFECVLNNGFVRIKVDFFFKTL